jgi:hypothetical protein
MSKYFSDIVAMKHENEEMMGPPHEFRFSAKDITLGITVMNSIKRSACSDILTYTIAPETIKFEENTTTWEPELITLHLIYLIIKPEYLDQLDLNMLELSLDVTGNQKYYQWVFCRDFVLTNRETKEVIPTDKIFVYPYTPLFAICEGEQAKITCSLEYSSKNLSVLKKTGSYARHQGGSIGIDYETDPEEPDKDPKEIFFSGNVQTGIDPQKMISLGIEVLLEKLKEIQEAIKSKNTSKFYVQIGKNSRYDLVILGENATIGNLVTRWINRHDMKSASSFEYNEEKHFVNINFGLAKFTPPLLRETVSAKNLEEMIDKSFAQINEKNEEKQREETINSFLEHLNRISEYLKEIADDWSKVKIRYTSVKEYVDEEEKLRFARYERLKNEKI